MVFLWGRVYVTGDPPPQLVAKKNDEKVGIENCSMGSSNDKQEEK